MQTVGYIDIEKYRCITDDITTDEVIITEERIQHIADHHPGHFEKAYPFLQMILENPDYILKDKNPNTGLLLKEVAVNESRFQVVLRLHTSTDTEGFKNSVISLWEIRGKEFERLIRSKKILYRRK